MSAEISDTSLGYSKYAALSLFIQSKGIFDCLCIFHTFCKLRVEHTGVTDDKLNDSGKTTVSRPRYGKEPTNKVKEVCMTLVWRCKDMYFASECKLMTPFNANEIRCVLFLSPFCSFLPCIKAHCCRGTVNCSCLEKGNNTIPI